MYQFKINKKSKLSLSSIIFSLKKFYISGKDQLSRNIANYLNEFISTKISITFFFVTTKIKISLQKLFYTIQKKYIYLC